MGRAGSRGTPVKTGGSSPCDAIRGKDVFAGGAVGLSGADTQTTGELLGAGALGNTTVAASQAAPVAAEAAAAMVRNPLFLMLLLLQVFTHFD